MLILSRKEGESIILTLEDDREIEVILLELRGNQAKIGIDADKSINIARDELFDLI